MGNVAVVTGAAGGAGRAIVDRLVADGWAVVGLDLNRDGLAAMAQEGFAPMVVDLMDAGAIKSTFARIEKALGGVDALINSAGVCYGGEFPEITEDALDCQMALNFGAAFHCCQAAIGQMLGSDSGGKIVNISCAGASDVNIPGPPHYRASKAALDNLTRDLARRYAQDPIRVNAIAPAMSDNRKVQPREIAAWVGFLLSEAGEASSGNVIVLNPGA